MQVSKLMRGIFRSIFDPFGVDIEGSSRSVGFTYG